VLLTASETMHITLNFILEEWRESAHI